MTSTKRIDLTMSESDADLALDLIHRVDAFAAAMRELGMVVTVSGSIGIVVRPAPADPDADVDAGCGCAGRPYGLHDVGCRFAEARPFA